MLFIIFAKLSTPLNITLLFYVNLDNSTTSTPIYPVFNQNLLESDTRNEAVAFVTDILVLNSSC